MYRAGKRTLPLKPPTAFIRRAWRPFVFKDGDIDRRAYELCVFSELRNRLRAGDVWVDRSRQYLTESRPIGCDDLGKNISITRSAKIEFDKIPVPAFRIDAHDESVELVFSGPRRCPPPLICSSKNL
jgi:hypothetical protein